MKKGSSIQSPPLPFPSFSTVTKILLYKTQQESHIPNRLNRPNRPNEIGQPDVPPTSKKDLAASAAEAQIEEIKIDQIRSAEEVNLIPHVTNNNWSNDVNMILEKIRINSILLSNEHKKSYFLLASKLKWFRIPMIMLSTMGSVIGVGLPTYVSIATVGIICSILSLVVSLIGSLELFLAIGTKMEGELIQSKELYLLAIEIQKTLLLDNMHRNGDGIAYLEDKFNMYSKLIEHSQLLECRIIDELTPLPEEYVKRVIPSMVDMVKQHNEQFGHHKMGGSLIQYSNDNHIIRFPRFLKRRSNVVRPFHGSGRIRPSPKSPIRSGDIRAFPTWYYDYYKNGIVNNKATRKKSPDRHNISKNIRREAKVKSKDNISNNHRNKRLNRTRHNLVIKPPRSYHSYEYKNGDSFGGGDGDGGGDSIGGINGSGENDVSDSQHQPSPPIDRVQDDHINVNDMRWNWSDTGIMDMYRNPLPTAEIPEISKTVFYPRTIKDKRRTSEPFIRPNLVPRNIILSNLRDDVIL